MVKNILILRFGNEFFGATWNRNHIDNVQVCFLSGIEKFRADGIRSHSRSLSEQRDEVATLMSSASFVMLCRTVSYKKRLHAEC
jgi:glucose-6-phosphate 1-dehydrogenase